MLSPPGIATVMTCALVLAAPHPAAAQQPSKPGEGVMCLLALTAAASRVAQVCHPGEALDLAKELHAGADRLGRYVVENGWSVAELDQFLRQQGRVDAPPEMICQTAAETVYQSFRGDPDALAASVAAATAQAGRPTWGDCL
ncbi:hypothetical protein [Phenylobacterium immobile]|uniref:hypothetical protein n=1 Tax=Phenylobacterium immobile TaxID=21 RepID=UPI000A7F49BB|nr:hypothetical protein [Phenylobacterium immobile]